MQKYNRRTTAQTHFGISNIQELGIDLLRSDLDGRAMRLAVGRRVDMNQPGPELAARRLRPPDRRAGERRDPGQCQQFPSIHVSPSSVVVIPYGRCAESTSQLLSLQYGQSAPTRKPLPVADSSSFSHQFSHARMIFVN